MTTFPLTSNSLNDGDSVSVTVTFDNGTVVIEQKYYSLESKVFLTQGEVRELAEKIKEFSK